jgi:hypothetical protein
MQRYFLYATLLLLTQCSKCKRDDPSPKVSEATLPAETQTGAYTFGCKLNGSVWLPSPQLFSGPTLSASYVPFPDNYLSVSASNYRSPIKQSMFFRLSGITGPGLYQITSGKPCYLDFNDTDRACVHDTLTSVQTGMVDITRFDPVAHIVSGRFSFSLRKPGCPTIDVTDGRFDIKY